MKKTFDLAKHQQEVNQDMETMSAAVKKAQAANLAKGVPIAYLIDGVMHYELPTGEVTREKPWREPGLESAKS